MAAINVSGLLVDGFFYIGGDGTGWVLKADDSVNIEVDVDQVHELALKYRRQRVTFTGHYTTTVYIERGPIKILVAEQIRLASETKGSK